MLEGQCGLHVGDLAADAGTLRTLRTGAAAKGGELLIIDMPELAQTSRVYDEYLDRLSGIKTEDLTYCAISLVGPRNTIGRLVRKLPLLR